MQLKDIKTLAQVARESGVHIQTLHSRLKNLDEGEYMKLGERMPILLSPEGVKRL
jgi:hypothetical protein